MNILTPHITPLGRFCHHTHRADEGTERARGMPRVTQPVRAELRFEPRMNPLAHQALQFLPRLSHLFPSPAPWCLPSWASFGYIPHPVSLPPPRTLPDLLASSGPDLHTCATLSSGPLCPQAPFPFQFSLECHFLSGPALGHPPACFSALALWPWSRPCFRRLSVSLP